MARPDHSMSKLHVTSENPATTKYPVPGWKLIVRLIVHYGCVIDKCICICSLTPRVIRPGGGTATQPDLRRDIAAAMQHEVLTCSVETFLTHYMPFSPSAVDITRALNILVGSRNLNLNKDEGEWNAFGGTTPSGSGENEETVFAPLETIVNCLVNLGSVCGSTTGERRDCNFRYHNCPTKFVRGESTGSGTFKLDACMRQKSVTSSEILSSDAAVIGEFKKKKDKSVRSVWLCWRWLWVGADI